MRFSEAERIYGHAADSLSDFCYYFIILDIRVGHRTEDYSSKDLSVAGTNRIWFWNYAGASRGSLFVRRLGKGLFGWSVLKIADRIIYQQYTPPVYSHCMGIYSGIVGSGSMDEYKHEQGSFGGLKDDLFNEWEKDTRRGFLSVWPGQSGELCVSFHPRAW